MKIAITAESTIDLPKNLLEEFGIETLPFTLIMGEKQALDEEIGSQELFDYVEESGQLPRTAAVNEYQFEQFFAKVLSHADHVIHLSLSSKISAACANATAVSKKEEFASKVDVIDSLSLSTGIALLAIYASKLAKQGLDPKEIVAKVEARRAYDQTSFVLETLDYLYKGGRCSKLAFFGANLLRLKPQILMGNGAMSPGAKYRGPLKKVVLEYVEDTLKEFNNIDPSIVFITNTLCPAEVVDAVKERLFKAGFQRVEETQAGGTIACHCGPHCLGILYLNDGKNH